MSKSEELRRHAAKCRTLADFIVSNNDKAVLHKAAADFDAEAEQADEADPASKGDEPSA